MKILYTKETKKKVNNPFYRCVNDNYQDALLNELNKNQNYITENLSHWIFNGTNEQKQFADWLLTIPDTNQYGKSERGEKDGIHNSPLSCLSGAINKLSKGKPGVADLSKTQITNLKRVITGLRNFDDTRFREIEWVEAVEGQETQETPMQKMRKQLKGNTFNSIFEI